MMPFKTIVHIKQEKLKQYIIIKSHLQSGIMGEGILAILHWLHASHEQKLDALEGQRALVGILHEAYDIVVLERARFRWIMSNRHVDSIANFCDDCLWVNDAWT